MTISKSKAVTNCEEMKDNCEVDASIKSKATFDNLMNTLKELEDDSESVLAESKYFTCKLIAHPMFCVWKVFLILVII